MIVTELYDGQGLGNQLWCYVVARAIALDKGYDFGIMHSEKFKGSDFLKLDFGKEVFGGSGPEGGPPLTLPDGVKYYYNERRINHPNGTDIRIHDPRLANIADGTKIDGIMQDERYILHRREEIREWLEVNKNQACLDYANKDTCVINFRGGEYVGLSDVFLTQKYWDDAISHMRKVNPNFRFVVITDDVVTAKKFFPELEVQHFDIGKDYSIINNAYYLILSNSSFGWFPAWLNTNLKFCIAPKYWARHNVSDGYWACGYNITLGWSYLSREGELYDYETCKKELESYVKKHRLLFTTPKIEKNFLVVSNYRNDLSWLPDYTKDYIVYDRSEMAIYPPELDQKKVVRQPNVGYNLYDYFTFIIDHYDSLPDTVIFMKGNTFPRHVGSEYFNRIVNNQFFTPIENYHLLESWPLCFLSPDGGILESNNSWYLNLGDDHPTKYFKSYNDFFNFCFKDAILPRFTRFAPGANYIVPRANILKLPRQFYENLRTFVSHSQLPGEAHLLERALHTLWTCNFEISDTMLRPLDEDFKLRLPESGPPLSLPIRILSSIKQRLTSFARKPTYQELIAAPRLQVAEQVKIEEYRKGVKIYDVFTFFNELDLLELRLNILAPYVDYFVIIESTETFSGKSKSLVYKENEERFKKFKDKIIHYVINDTPENETDLRSRLEKKNIMPVEREIINNTLTSDNVPDGQLHWLKEFYQKESIKKALVHLSDTDICFVGDVDEIWNPEAIIDYRKDDIYKLKQNVHPYYFNNRSNEPWAGTLVTKYKNIKYCCLNHLRTVTKTRYTYIADGGWHFTNQGGADRIREKLESYGHQEFNNLSIKSSLEDKIDSNKDFIGRDFEFWQDESDLPEYVINNKLKYRQFFKQ